MAATSSSPSSLDPKLIDKLLVLFRKGFEDPYFFQEFVGEPVETLLKSGFDDPDIDLVFEHMRQVKSALQEGINRRDPTW